MKKTLLVLVAAFAILAQGCSSNVPQKEHDKVVKSDEIKATEKTDSKEEKENDQEEKIELPSDFKKATNEELLSIPDSANLTSVASDIVASIGVEDVSTVVYGNYVEDSLCSTVDSYIVTNTCKRLLLMMQYITVDSPNISPEWDVVFVKDADTGDYYYVPDEIKNTVDLYDYKNGKLISKKSETHKDVQKRIDQRNKEIDQEFEDMLDELKDKYMN